jgi:hypothetical protein
VEFMSRASSASVKYHTGGTYSKASVKAVIAAHLPEDSACGMSHTYSIAEAQ